MKNFNIIISGVGGQGIITLLQIIDESAFVQGYDVKSSELHGLSQRGGSVLAHIRLGEKVNSPMVDLGKANFILGTELTEGFRAINFSNKETIFLLNKNTIPYLGGLPAEEIIEKLPKQNVHLISASDICKEKLGKEVVSGIYLLGYAVAQNLIPLKKESVLKAIKNIVPEKYQELNIKAFNLSCQIKL